VGRPRHPLNSAGILDSAKLHEITLEQWRRIVDVNFWGVVYGCHAFVPMLIRQNSGYVLNMASSAGLFALPEMALYSAPKAAVIALSEPMKAELARYGIGVTVSCPAAFSSDILNKESATTSTTSRTTRWKSCGSSSDSCRRRSTPCSPGCTRTRNGGSRKDEKSTARWAEFG